MPPICRAHVQCIADVENRGYDQDKTVGNGKKHHSLTQVYLCYRKTCLFNLCYPLRVLQCQIRFDILTVFAVMIIL